MREASPRSSGSLVQKLSSFPADFQPRPSLSSSLDLDLPYAIWACRGGRRGSLSGWTAHLLLQMQ